MNDDDDDDCFEEEVGLCLGRRGNYGERERKKI